MSYGRSHSAQELDPETVRKISQLMGLELSQEDLNSLKKSLAEQLASVNVLDELDLTDIASILVMDPRWHE